MTEMRRYVGHEKTVVNHLRESWLFQPDTFSRNMIQNFWLELLIIACAAPLLAHHFRTEQMAKICRKIDPPCNITFWTMVFHPRYWQLWSLRQWEVHLARQEDAEGKLRRG
ncbi:hypothetical protein [Burkholderia diffusa]|uniref:hypothetical protein n=1 Tax=Burkholderia diffusa TaxID=488732 RepID=UPI001582CA80|nr:hypothetical protein [Burkholderia diffusa]